MMPPMPKIENKKFYLINKDGTKTEINPVISYTKLVPKQKQNVFLELCEKNGSPVNPENYNDETRIAIEEVTKALLF